jgi:hypothetical protein
MSMQAIPWSDRIDALPLIQQHVCMDGHAKDVSQHWHVLNSIQTDDKTQGGLARGLTEKGISIKYILMGLEIECHP